MRIIPLRSAIDCQESTLDVERDVLLCELSSLSGLTFVRENKREIPALFIIETGGTEEQFKNLFHSVEPPYYLLSTNARNSLPAALEISAFLRDQSIPVEIIQGQIVTMAKRLREIADDRAAKRIIKAARLGIVGKPSDWLIASNIDRVRAKEVFGVDFIDISFSEFQKEIAKADYPHDEITAKVAEKAANSQYLAVALDIYGALKRLQQKYFLDGLSVRCFDLLSTCKNTSCLALALLNAQGLSAGCEGDLPILLSMHLIKDVLDQPSFQANPSQVDIDDHTIVFAHCTIPLSMCQSYQFDTHFESGLGLGIRGAIALGPCTVFRLSADLRSAYIKEGKIIANPSRSDLCRTQVVIRMESGLLELLSQPLGNHHLIMRGHHAERLANYLLSRDRHLRII